MNSRAVNQRFLVSSKTNYESTSEYRCLADEVPNYKKMDRHRKDTQSLEELLMKLNDLDAQRYAQRVRLCSQTLLFILQANSEGELQHRLKNAFFCRFRHCPVCQARRAKRNYARFLQTLPNVLELHPNVRWVFLTLTVPNVPITQLRETLQRMNKAWDRFNKLKEFRHVLAWVKSTEITKENIKRTKRKGYAHPHFHVLLMVKSSYFFGENYINRDDWLKAWQKSYRDDSIVAVNVRIADRHKGEKLQGESLVKSVSELMKYSVKPSDMVQDQEWVLHLIRQVHKMRFLSSGGALKGVFVDAPMNEELLLGDEAIPDQADTDQLKTLIWYQWQRQQKRYARKVKVS